METMTISFSGPYAIYIEVGDTLTLEGDARLWSVLSVEGDDVTVIEVVDDLCEVELVQVH